jgi:hypothetical protein
MNLSPLNRVKFVLSDPMIIAAMVAPGFYKSRHYGSGQFRL